MRIAFLAALLFCNNSIASDESPLRELEANCWSKTAENGSFLCQYLMLLGKIDGHEGWLVPELYAPENEEKRWRQAHLACERLGFSYSKGFELGEAKSERLMARLEPTKAFAWHGKGAFIQHLLCN
jgi:hypothetical protein